MALPIAGEYATVPGLDHEPLPPLYKAWVRAATGFLPLRETRATCSACPMCAAKDSAATAFVPFRLPVKCCTYAPILPNYLVGQILSAEPSDAPGRLTVLQRIDYQAGVTPLGLAQPPLYELTYRAVDDRCFGRASPLQCPHLIADQGTCGIWQHRNGVCSTWFCKHRKGAAGYYYWRDIEAMLTAVENELTVWSCQQLGLDTNSLRRLLAFRKGRSADRVAAELLGESATIARQLWGKWFQREVQFYAAAGQLVAQLSWDDVERIGGPEIQVRREFAKASMQLLFSEGLPDRVRPGKFSTTVTSDGTLLGATYSRNDAVLLTEAHLSVIRAAVAQPSTNELLAGGTDERVLRLLVEYGFLESAESSE